MTLYRFALFDGSDVLRMTTELTDPDPTQDYEFWQMFMTGEYAMVYVVDEGADYDD
jgi:hypothetical protein